MSKHEKKTICIVGLGYVGLPLAVLAAKKGYNVIGIDKDETKVTLLNNNILPFQDDKKMAEDFKKVKIEATNTFERVGETSIAIVCVPTPVDEAHNPDLGPVKSAVSGIGKYISKGHLVIIESTINPGVCESIILPILEKTSGLKAGKDFYLSHCPERINPGDKKWTVRNIPRVVGSLESAGLKKTVAFYKSIVEAEIRPMASLKEAEAVKIVENAFRDINIAFVNELAQSFSHLNIDTVNVINGAATKPFSFLPHYPSCGVGGHCIPVDPYYLIDYARRNGFNHRFLSLARNINNSMPQFTVDLAKELLGEKNIPISKAKITVLGLSYKANVSDCRESPSFKIIEELKHQGADVAVYDPYVKEKSTVNSTEEAVNKADVVIIAAAHKEFCNLTPKFFLKHKVNAIVDGQNCLNKEKFTAAGIIYEGIGRHHYHDNLNTHHRNIKQKALQ
ncbi:MAG: nucleotide sugar dehydrogenase [Patescibacteria group bacterium]